MLRISDGNRMYSNEYSLHMFLETPQIMFLLPKLLHQLQEGRQLRIELE